ncbi:hypothetical protein FPQ18DRAFT_67577 [Pyronema domesticum]|uniref:Similar to Protein GRISEA acc. no. Q92258 n=1 Tax=Pyronema omphalodes (strain CBS 100304) TaxID=1076935 RepID=U4LMX6_PYROM|nr:hypothetical protein FPQ18DRAFT_67577 [Pyronema domesticum]CCX15574.1 Similar to Protein GRISEA; acc. no. Q92258 [Pyronema omphalodes CBS 100304]
MPTWQGAKWACSPCMKGHRSTKCTHHDRMLYKVRRPGRPLNNCNHQEEMAPGALKVGATDEEISKYVRGCDCNKESFQVAIPIPKDNCGNCSFPPDPRPGYSSPTNSLHHSVLGGRVGKPQWPASGQRPSNGDISEHLLKHYTELNTPGIYSGQATPMMTPDFSQLHILSPQPPPSSPGNGIMKEQFPAGFSQNPPILRQEDYFTSPFGPPLDRSTPSATGGAAGGGCCKSKQPQQPQPQQQQAPPQSPSVWTTPSLPDPLPTIPTSPPPASGSAGGCCSSKRKPSVTTTRPPSANSYAQSPPPQQPDSSLQVTFRIPSRLRNDPIVSTTFLNFYEQLRNMGISVEPQRSFTPGGTSIPNSLPNSPPPAPSGCCTTRQSSNKTDASTTNGNGASEGQETKHCQCGDSCRCVPCAEHPNNPAMIAQIRSDALLMASNSHSSSNTPLSPTELAFWNDWTEDTPSGGMDEDTDGMEDGRNMDMGGGYVIYNYDFPCEDQACLCGAGCTCVGCTQHSGHTGGFQEALGFTGGMEMQMGQL